MAKAELEKAIVDLGLVVTAEFVPYSKSRSYKKDAKVGERNLNWKVTLHRMPKVLSDEDSALQRPNAHAILTTDYRAYIAPSGNIYPAGAGSGKSKPITPDSVDVIWSLVQDASVLDHATFESWVEEYCGYETDSRKAEAIYRECLALALALRNGIGDAGLKTLQEAAQDY